MWDLLDNIKWASLCIIGILEEEKGKRVEVIVEEIMPENFPNFKKETDSQAQEAQTKRTQTNLHQDML